MPGDCRAASHGSFLPRDAMHKCGLCRHAVSVCLPVCPCVRVCHVRELRHNEQRHLRIFFTIEYPHHSSFSIPNEMGIIRRNPFNGGVECRWGRQKTRFWTNIWLNIQSTVLSTVRVANCEKQSRSLDGRRRASSTPRRPSSPWS